MAKGQGLYLQSRKKGAAQWLDEVFLLIFLLIFQLIFYTEKYCFFIDFFDPFIDSFIEKKFPQNHLKLIDLKAKSIRIFLN